MKHFVLVGQLGDGSPCPGDEITKQLLAEGTTWKQAAGQFPIVTVGTLSELNAPEELEKKYASILNFFDDNSIHYGSCPSCFSLHLPQLKEGEIIILTELINNMVPVIIGHEITLRHVSALSITDKTLFMVEAFF